MKFITLVLFILYASFCIGTMPRSCWEPSNVIMCQRIQITALNGMYTVSWPSVHALRRSS